MGIQPDANHDVPTIYSRCQGAVYNRLCRNLSGLSGVRLKVSTGEQTGDRLLHASCCFGIALRRGAGRFKVVEDHALSLHEWGAEAGNLRRDFKGNLNDSVAVGVQQVARLNPQSADSYRNLDFRNVTI